MHQQAERMSSRAAPPPQLGICGLLLQLRDVQTCSVTLRRRCGPADRATCCVRDCRCELWAVAWTELHARPCDSHPMVSQVPIKRQKDFTLSWGPKKTWVLQQKVVCALRRSSHCSRKASLWIWWLGSEVGLCTLQEGHGG